MNDKINTGGPAFPVHGGYKNDDPRNMIIGGGMTLRDWYAGMAMQGIISSGGNPLLPFYPTYSHHTEETIGTYAYLVADEMLKARAK